MDATSVFHMLDSHEDRIQRIEDLIVRVSNLGTEQHAVSLAIKDQLGSITDQLASMKDQNSRIQALETIKESFDIKRAHKSAFWAKIAINVVSGILGAVVAMGVAWLKTK